MTPSKTSKGDSRAGLVSRRREPAAIGNVSARPVESLWDTFDEDRVPGTVIGSNATSGAKRLGSDLEAGVSVDHGALRFRYLLDAGWGRASLAYGPFVDQPGLALVVRLLDGLTTSQTPDTPEGRREKLARWRRTFPRVTRLRPELRQNLAVGWFGCAVPRAPADDGVAVVIGAAPTAEGLMEACADGASFPVVPRVQNVPVTVFCVRRSHDTVLYASSLDSTVGFAPYPTMRPLAIVPDPVGPRKRSLFAGVHQSVLGEVKYRVDTRVYAVGVARVGDLAGLGTAHAADIFDRRLNLDGARAQRGGPWTVISGSFEADAGGLRANEPGSCAMLVPDQPSGLIRLSFETGPDAASVGIRCRGHEDGSAWQLVAGPDGTSLDVVGPKPRALASDQARVLAPHEEHVLSVLDDGVRLGAYLDGALLFGGFVSDSGGASGRAIGLSIGEATGVRLREFEAHPRVVPIPPALDVGTVPMPMAAGPVGELVVDGFDGPAGDLAADRIPSGAPTWVRVLGIGVMERTGDGQARVRADRSKPNPGRTVYAVRWDDPTFADLAVTVVPPGTARTEGHQARGGIAMWQDAENHLVINNFMDDVSVGVSISAFLRVFGHEQMYDYDATWSNVGDRIRHGVPYRLRVVFDGERFVVYVDGEMVLYRALTDYRAEAPRLTIKGVGLVANWEWGDDTGTAFDDFVARGSV